MTIFKRIVLLIFFKLQVRRIKKESIVAYDNGVREVKKQILHDTTVPEEEIDSRCLEKASLLRLQIAEDSRRRIQELGDSVKREMKK